MGKKLFLVIVCVALAAVLLAGCNESYKVKAVETDMSDSTVTSNGGLAVKYGKYLYYVNGYAGKDVDNSFGDVQKGAIARVELDAGGNPIKDTNRIIVAKNVYNTTKTSGLYIADGYIYFSTPSIDRNSSGDPKTGEMWLMRTALDGTDSKVVKKFDDYTAVYKVVSGYVLYVLSGELHAIDTGSKKLVDTKIDEDVSSYYFTTYEKGQNAFIDSVFYLKASENENDYFNVLWHYKAGGDKQKVFEANAATYNVQDVYATGFQLTLVDADYTADKIRLIYNKTDSGTNTTSLGTYSYLFDSSLTFDASKEIRYSNKTTYTAFNFLNDTTALIKNSYNVELLSRASDGTWIRQSLIPNSSADITVLDIVETDSKVAVYYLLSNVVYKINVLNKTIADGVANYSVNIESSSIFFDSGFASEWLGLDLVGNRVYFFNSKVSNYTYYVDLSNVADRNTDSRMANLLSIVTEADKVAQLTSAS